MCTHAMLNDICLPCCHLAKTPPDDILLNFYPHVPMNTQIIVTVYLKNYIDNTVNETSPYEDMYHKIIHIVIYQILIISSKCD